jgi:hypothetical protein
MRFVAFERVGRSWDMRSLRGCDGFLGAGVTPSRRLSRGVALLQLSTCSCLYAFAARLYLRMTFSASGIFHPLFLLPYNVCITLCLYLYSCLHSPSLPCLYHACLPTFVHLTLHVCWLLPHLVSPHTSLLCLHTPTACHIQGWCRWLGACTPLGGGGGGRFLLGIDIRSQQ